MTRWRLIAFDLDGTLIDSRRDLAESTNELLAAHGGVPLPIETVTSFVGDGAQVLVKRALRETGVKLDLHRALDEFLQIYDRRLLVHTRPYEGIPELLASLDGRATLAVLTNKPGRHTRAILDALDLTKHFAQVIGGDGAYPRKPDPASLLALMDAAGARPEQTLMVGDSMVDVETARRAGTRVCVALYGFGQARGLALDGTELVAATPRDLIAAID